MDVSVAVHFLGSPDDEAENIARLSRRELRDKYNVLDLPPNQFVANFRVTKVIFKMILQILMTQGAPSYRSTSIRPDIKLATFLQFLATGSYQQTVGNEMFSSMCKATVCNVIEEYLNFFEDNICGNWIKMRHSEDVMKQAFFQSKGFPGIIGCVDGTHIRIKAPGSDVKHLYYNRKGYYSINAMVICDHNTYIMNVDARHPGANHDAFVWEHNSIDQKLKREFESGQRNRWILGDSGYKLKTYLMTPFRNPTSASEILFNKKHSSARNVVERCFGALKNRFRCILGSRGLHYEPHKTTKIINVCCALHNMCIHYKCPEPEYVDTYINEALEEVAEGLETEGAAAIRRTIAMSL